MRHTQYLHIATILTLLGRWVDQWQAPGSWHHQDTRSCKGLVAVLYSAAPAGILCTGAQTPGLTPHTLPSITD